MPRDLTHVIFADDIRDGLDSKTADVLARHADAYHMGSISHDSFLYGKHPQWARKMHGGNGEDTRSVVFSMLDDVRKEKNSETQEKKKAFAFGFLTHMAVDSCFHPLVYSLSGSQLKENCKSEKEADAAMGKHRLIESFLDMHYVAKKGYDFDNFRPFHKINKNLADKRMLRDFFSRSFERAFPVEGDVSLNYRIGLTAQLFLGRVTKNQTLGKMIDRVDRFFGGHLKSLTDGFYRKDEQVPAKLTDFSSFIHPVTGVAVERTLPEIEKASVERGRRFISAANEYLKTADKNAFKAKIPCYNLDTGVPYTALADIKHYKPLTNRELTGAKIKKFAQGTTVKAMTSGAKALKSGGTKLAYPAVFGMIATVSAGASKIAAMRAVKAKKQR